MSARNRKLQAARHAAHVALDSLWNTVQGEARWRKRDGCYRWLAEHFGMARRECHIRDFDIGMCEAVIDLVEGVKAGIIPGPQVSREAQRIRFDDRMRTRVKRLQKGRTA